jgi:hypothetical protein
VVNPGTDGGLVRAHHLTSTVQHLQAPSQSWHASHLQWRHGTCQGFVASTQTVEPGAAAAVGMGYWTEDDLPFSYGLARTFPLADHWFSSCLGPTFPDRRFLIAGTAHGLLDDLPFDLGDYPPAGTIFDVLTRHGISWVNDHAAPGDRSMGPPPRPSHAAYGAAAAAPDGPGAALGDRGVSRRTCSSPPTCSRSASAGSGPRITRPGGGNAVARSARK